MAQTKSFEGKAEGWKFTAAALNIFAEEVRRMYTYGNVIEQHGYYIDGRGWWLHESGEEGEEKSYRVKARRYRERKWRWLVLDSVVAIEEGW